MLMENKKKILVSRQVENSAAPAPVPHFYSIHSWLGLATMAVYAIQVFIICAIIIVPFIIRPSSFAVCGRRLQLPPPPLL